MKSVPKCTDTRFPAPAFAARPVKEYLEAKQTDLRQAARLLGGHEAALLVDRCAEVLTAEGTIGSRVEMMLQQILSLLTLERTHHEDSPYMGYFVAIDPSDPVVEEICLLADGLRNAIDASEARRNWASRLEEFVSRFESSSFRRRRQRRN